MKKLIIILISSILTSVSYGVDFTVELTPAANSVGDTQLSSISISKVTNLQSSLDSKADQSSVTSSLALKANISSLGPFATASSLSSSDIPSLLSSKISDLKRDNLIINGNFVLNQRGYVSNTSLTANTYGHDRWRAGSSTTQYSFTQLSTSTLITINSGSLRQTIEDTNILGGSYTLSWAGTAQCSLQTGRSPSPVYNSSPITLGSVAAGSELTVECHSGTLNLVQLNIGSEVSPFVLAGKNFSGEVLLAQRYYEKSYDLATPPGSATNNGFYVSFATSGNYISGGIRFKTAMKGSPTVTIYNPSTGATGQCRGLSGGSALALSAQNPGNSGFAFFAQTTTTDYYGFQYTADSELY